SDAKLSSISLTVAYTQYRQILLPLIANIWSKDQKWQYSTDWRYMKFPSETWGVEEQRKPEDGFSIDFSYLKIHQLALRAVKKNLFVGTGVYFDNLWNIRELSTPPDGSSDFEKYNLDEPEVAFAFPIRILYDTRLNQINPKNGWFFTLTYRNNFKALGNTKPWQSVVLDLRKYIQVSKSGNVLAFWLYSWQSTAQTPYLLLPSTGWDDNFNTARGYIQGRYRSTSLHYAEAEYRFKITPNGLLGGVAFANLQAYKLNLNEGPYAFAPAVGTGLRIKLNKKSGANLCIDYGVGQHNSHGFFINFSELF
ncbi:MAG TPA: BamA/TamA family outer membrane protein, partial [Cyclobacteriaceae bacterium]|nr:BamA/TamA family outer membrane protein [Cyclobacteriaceae bacterium]